MRLVVATPLYPPEGGGPATYAKALVEGMPAHEVEITLVKFSEVRHLPKLVRHIAYYRRVLRAAREADMVLALDPVSVGLPALWAAKRARKPFVVKIVGDYAWEQGRQRFGVKADLDTFVMTKDVPFAVRVLRNIETKVARGAAAIIVPSEYLKGVVSAWDGDLKEKIKVIYNAVPTKSLGEVPEAVARLPRPLVVTVARLVPWKHIDAVIDAVQGVPGAALAIVGDGPLRGALAAHAEEKLSERAVLTGELSHADTLAVLKSADVFVLNSSYEGLSHLLIEAMTLGVPTIATRVGGNPEVITDGENGVLVPVGDTPSLIRALEKMLGDTELRARFGAHAIQSAKRFSLETMLASTAKLLQTRT